MRNPFLPELDFEFSVNLNLPLYNNLKFTGGSILINDFGHKGVILYNLNNNNYLAWEASCPNHKPNSCSKTEINGSLAVCRCENYQYSLATGQLINPSPSTTKNRIASNINGKANWMSANLIIMSSVSLP